VGPFYWPGSGGERGPDEHPSVRPTRAASLDARSAPRRGECAQPARANPSLAPVREAHCRRGSAELSSIPGSTALHPG